MDTIDLEYDETISIMGQAVNTGRSQLVGDVTQCEDCIEYDPDTRSELAVPIKLGEKVIGVIDVKHPDHDAFDEEDQRWLESLAAQAALAIQNAQRYQDLEQIKGFVGSQTALDWMMVSTAWGHNIKRETGKALVCVELVRQAHIKKDHQKVLAELGDLEATVQGIREIPITAPLSAEDAVSSVRVNRIVQGYLRNLWRHARYRSVELKCELQPDLDDLVTVRASKEWLRRGLEIVVENAVQTMLGTDNPSKRLSVATRLVDAKVEILVGDTGPGIPEEIRDRIFKEPIDKPEGSRGAGVGLVLARNIFEAYQGSITVRETGPSGTVIGISLPVEVNKH
jgi:K+-sensing histidine kinase KdpD